MKHANNCVLWVLEREEKEKRIKNVYSECGWKFLKTEEGIRYPASGVTVQSKVKL